MFLGIISKSLGNVSRIPLFKLTKRSYLSVPKDVNIYNHSNTGFTRFIGFCGFGQWLVVSYMSIVSFQSMPVFFNWIPADEKSDENRKRLPLADWKYRVGFGIFTLAAASAIMATTFVYCLRSLTGITLLKNSDKVLFTTYTPLGTQRSFIASVNDVSAIQPRSTIMTQVPLKIKDTYFHFLVDKSGKFPQPSLFDRTVGIKRDFGFQKK